MLYLSAVVRIDGGEIRANECYEIMRIRMALLTFGGCYT